MVHDAEYYILKAQNGKVALEMIADTVDTEGGIDPALDAGPAQDEMAAGC